jgi:hypothetical protein
VHVTTGYTEDSPCVSRITIEAIYMFAACESYRLPGDACCELPGWISAKVFRGLAKTAEQAAHPVAKI